MESWLTILIIILVLAFLLGGVGWLLAGVLRIILIIVLIVLAVGLITRLLRAV